MDLTRVFEGLQASLGETLPNILGALVILVLGWLVAVLVRFATRKAVSFFKLNDRIHSATGSRVNIEAGLASGVYYLILFLVFVAFFEALNFQLVSAPLQGLVTEVLGFLPRLVASGVLLLVAWILATIVRRLVTGGLAATKLDQRLTSETGVAPVSTSLGNVVYWLVILFFLPAILGALELKGLLDPVEGLVNEILAMLPNVFAATVIGVIGWLVAKILSNLVTNLLSAAGLDRVGERAGLAGTMTLSQLVGLIVYIFVLIPALIAALNAVRIEAISAPATEMLGAFMAAIPNIFAAALILAIAYVVSVFIANLATTLLSGLGFDRLPEKLGIGGAFRQKTKPSQLIGRLIVFFVMLFATVEAAERLGFSEVADLVSMFIQFGAQVLLGVVIIIVGLWISNLAHDTIVRVSGRNARALAAVARVAILGIVIAMGLRAMGLADDIVTLAFGLALGAVAVAVALAFGLGGREAAGKQMEHWLKKLRGEGGS